MRETVVIRGSRIQIVLNGEGPFEEARALTAEQLADLRAEFGDSLVLEGAIEQHRPEIPHFHIAQSVDQKAGQS